MVIKISFAFRRDPMLSSPSANGMLRRLSSCVALAHSIAHHCFGSSNGAPFKVASRMKYSFNCTECSRVIHFEWSQVGRKISCEGCGQSLNVPAPMETIGEPDARPVRLKFRCPSCRRKFSTKPDMAGEKIRCSGCGAGVRVPWAGEESATSASQPVLELFDLDDEPSAAPSPSRVEARPAPVTRKGESARPAESPRADHSRVDVSRAGARQPGARSEIADGSSTLAPELEALAGLEGSSGRRRAESVLSSRSQLMESVRQQAAEQEAVATQKSVAKDPTKKGPKKKKKKKKHSGFFDPKETLKLVAGVLVVVAVLAFAAWRFPDFRVPLGGFLCLVGFIVYVMGAVSLRQLVAEEGAIKLLLFRVCPPYQWWFVMTHWDEAKDFFAFFVAGAMILSLGGGIIKISPLAQKAAAEQRAYQKKVEQRRAEMQPPGVPTIVEREDD